MTAIQYFRDKIGMTQVELAKVLGVSQGAVANWESGARTPDILKLKRISEVLGCTVDDLLKEHESEQE